ncbi:DUF2306 domain-containing protein [Povalibacter sp.]|uniref:DUF2306 domain-containing protein n=1 Tax=Povalibacter sp. TaxID=1962978 RepID=UPI002F422AEE
MATTEALARHPTATGDRSSLILCWSSRALTATVWISAALFGLYILAFYAAALIDGNIEKWNEGLPRLYESHTPLATAGIGLHFAAGGIILALGCIQVVSAIRNRYPALHRWIGRVYVSAAFLTGLGGLTFIFTKGTIGGPVMDVGFGIYGALVSFTAVQAYRHARARRFEQHRAWALRLFALAIGSWLYRMDYGFWFLLAGGAGHTEEFRGPFDAVMAFFFYVPNLIVVEALLRAPRSNASPMFRYTASAAFTVATGFLLLGTYYFTKVYWGPAILARLA